MENENQQPKIVRVVKFEPATSVSQPKVTAVICSAKESNDSNSCGNWESYEAEAEDDTEDFPDKSIWLDGAIKFLLSAVKELHVKIGKIPQLRTRKNMWQEIERRLQSRGYTFTQKQIENKYFSLERAYRRAKQQTNSNGRMRNICAYEKELEELIERKTVVIKPEIVRERKTIGNRLIDESSTEQITIPDEEIIIPDDQVTTPGPSSQLPKSSSTFNDCENVRNEPRNKRDSFKVSRILRCMLEQQSEYNQQFLQLMHDIREDMKRSDITKEALLQEQNDLLKKLLEKF